MDDNVIRERLRTVPIAEAVMADPGMVVVLRARVEDAGLDGDEVERWVEGHGGYTGTVLGAQSESLGAGRAPKPAGPVERYFAIPEGALE